MSIPVYDELEMSVRTYNVLNGNGIDTVEAFLSLSPVEVLKLDNAGITVVEEIHNLQEQVRNLEISWDEQRIIDTAVKLNQSIYECAHEVTLAVNSDGFVEVHRRLA